MRNFSLKLIFLLLTGAVFLSAANVTVVDPVSKTIGGTVAVGNNLYLEGSNQITLSVDNSAGATPIYLRAKITPLTAEMPPLPANTICWNKHYINNGSFLYGGSNVPYSESESYIAVISANATATVQLGTNIKYIPAVYKKGRYDFELEFIVD